jgi:hypothetical protein
MAKAGKNNIEEPKGTVVDATQQKDARVEFEQRFDFFMSQFREVCKEAEAPVAIAIVLDIQNPSTPFVYSHGHIYDQATLLAKVLRDMKRKIIEEISA